MFGFRKTAGKNDGSARSIPSHIAIIMDGNGRWAKKRSLPRSAGHSAGGDNFVSTVGRCDDLGVRYLTVYAFSTENWKRSESEISCLISLMHKFIAGYTPQLIERNIRLVLLGDMSRFDDATRASLEKSVETLKNNTGMTLCIALNYGGRADIVYAVNKLIASGKTSVTENDITDALYTASIPDPDLIIRTSGEIRLSNFLLWQCAYSEFYFTDALWPDFDEAELKKAIQAYSQRKRRFGKE